MLTTLLGPLAVLSSWAAIENRVKEYYVFMLMLQAGMLGVFISLDFFLFYVFWEVMLVPMYFLIGVWGGPRKLYAAIKFFLYTLVGSVLLLLGILALYFIYPSIAAQHPEIAAQFGAGRHSMCWRFMPSGSTCPSTFNIGYSWRSSSDSPSKFRCSRSTRGFRMPTSKRPPQDRSFWPACC